MNMNKLLNLSRRKKIIYQIIVDTTLLLLSFIMVMAILHKSFSISNLSTDWPVLFLSITSTLLAFWKLGLYQNLVRFLTGKILVTVAFGALVAGISLSIPGLVYANNLPRSASISFTVAAFFSLSSVRFAARALFRRHHLSEKQPVIIYGAGEVGRQLLNALFHGRDYAPVGFIDDDPSKQNLNIGGLKVHSAENIQHLAAKTGARKVLLAMPSLSRDQTQKIIDALEKLELEIQSVPRMSDIISGKAEISQLQTVLVEDFLGRDPVPPIPELLSKNTTGNNILVSGAGGTIGSELCRQIIAQNPTVLLLYDISEFGLYTVAAELNAIVSRLQYEIQVIPILGSVQNSRQLQSAIKAYEIKTIYHAAAYKHVPIIEENIIAGVRNNVFGTLEISTAAKELGVENFIMVSTDKAVRPTNIMGATKRIAELICQAHAQEDTSCVFSVVRFGNVLGSSGSVIPLFRAQIQSGGPVTVTHTDVTRYFMTIPEAAQLVLQAGALGQGGDVFVLDMGEPVKIIDLAFSIIKRHGFSPYIVDSEDPRFPKKGDMPVLVSGLRKGEKLFEELLINDCARPTRHPRIQTALETSLPKDVLMGSIDRLRVACEDSDLPTVIKILHELPLNYTPLSTAISDLLWEAEPNTNHTNSTKAEKSNWA